MASSQLPRGKNVCSLKTAFRGKSHPHIVCLLLFQYQCCGGQLASQHRVREQCGCWLFEYTVIKPSHFVDISCCVRGFREPKQENEKAPNPAGHKEKLTMYIFTIYTFLNQRQATQKTPPSSHFFLF